MSSLPAASADSLDPEFGHWLAGFVDGEGHFAITMRVRRGRAREGWALAFKIVLRDDDRALLDDAQRRTGLGTVYQRPQRRPTEGAGAEWVVSRKADVLALVGIFDRYPLRSKKARDFVIWRRAVIASQELRPCVKRVTAAHDRIAECYEEIRACRRYQTVPIVVEPPVVPAELCLPI